MWRELIIDTVRRPRQAARRVLEFGLPLSTVLEAALLITCAGVVLGYLGLWLTGDAGELPPGLLAHPLAWVIAELVALALSVLLTTRIGRLFGGKGTAEGATKLIVWLNAMMLLVQLAYIAALAVMPPLAGLVTLGGAFWALWAFSSFVAELHGFKNALIVLGGVVMATIMLALGSTMLLAIVGVS